MKLLIPFELVQRLKRELRRGGTREIGGVLVGEHADSTSFRLVDFSVQHSGGTRTHFLRDVEHNQAFLAKFFERTGYDYKKYNYIGEWHSHPLFPVHPSGEDLATMHDLIRDPNVGVSFVILVIVRAVRGQIEMSATAFTAHRTDETMTVELEQPLEAPGWFEKLKQFLGL